MNIFLIYAGLSVLLITLLAMNISRLRMREKVANGDGGNKLLTKAIRAHMNSVEHILPYALLVYAMCYEGLAPALLEVMAFGFLAVRVLHAWSMLGSKFKLRQVTAGLVYVFELAGVVVVLANIP